MAAIGIVNLVLALELKDGAGEFLVGPVLPDSVVLVTVGVLTKIGSIAGLFPARKAATVEPVALLRYE